MRSNWALEARGLKILDSDPYNIANRLKEYDKDLRLCWNPQRNEYQVWTVYGNCTALSNELDYRLIEMTKRSDGRTEYGFKAKMDELKAQKEYNEKRERIEAHDNSIAMRKELHGLDVGRKSFAM